MKKFASLFHDLDSMTKTNERLDRLMTYFEDASPKDSIWVCWFLAGNRIKGAIKTGELRSFLSEKVNLPIWLIEECHDRVGDLAETVSLLAVPTPRILLVLLKQSKNFSYLCVQWTLKRGKQHFTEHGIYSPWMKCCLFISFSPEVFEWVYLRELMQGFAQWVKWSRR